MATICVTGSTDGIGLATATLLLARGHRVLLHARSERRGEQVTAGMAGDLDVVVGDLAELAQVRALGARLRAEPLDALVHNAGVWVRGDTPVRTVDGVETTFGVNVLAPHLLTRAVAKHLGGRVLWLGSGMARSGRSDPPRPGAELLSTATDHRRAYADSKAADVALAIAWGRRLDVPSAAVDPGWVPTKLASPGAPGHVATSAESLAWLVTDAPVHTAPYWKGRRPVAVPPAIRDTARQDALFAACDELCGIGPTGRER